MTEQGRPVAAGPRGYALLALLASSAVLLAMLALAIPRMAMQAQRVKEERLIERGKQFERAIMLYYRQHAKYPEDLEDLEETDGRRFLRRRYVDPIGDTGEWRLIHMGTDGRFEDSLLYDLSKDQTMQSAGGFPGLAGSLAADPGLAQAPVSPVLPGTVRAGPSPPGPQHPQQPFQLADRARTVRDSAAPDLALRNRYSQGFGFEGGQEGTPSATDAASGQPDYSRMLPSLVPMNENEPDRSGRLGRLGRRERIGNDPRNTPANNAGGGAFQGVADIQRGGMGGTAPTPGIAGAMREPGTAFPQGNPAALAAGSGAPAVIHRLLTSPRPGGLAGTANTPGRTAGARTFSRGIAGVASKSEAEGVKVYNGKELLNEWEFVYDYRKDGSLQNQAGPTQPTEAPARQGQGRRAIDRSGRPVR